MAVPIPKGYFTILEFMMMNEFERKVAAADFQRMFTNPGESIDEIARTVATRPVQRTKKKARKVSRYSRALSKELKSVRKAATLKSGKLRKGMTPAKILKKAHKNVKRRLK